MTGLGFIRNEVMGITMEELARELGVSKQIIYMWESGRKKIPAARLEQLSNMTGIPSQMFLAEDLTDRERLEIRSLSLQKEIRDTSMEYENLTDDSNGDPMTFFDPELLQQAEYVNEQIRFKDLMEKQRVVIGLVLDEHWQDEYNTVRNRLNVLDRFTDILSSRQRLPMLYQILRAMELAFDVNVQRKHLVGAAPSESTDLVPDNLPLVQEICNVLRRYQETHQAN